MTSRFKERLARGHSVVVMNPDHPSASLVEFLARLDVDAVMIDTEQGSPDVETVEDMARAARLVGLCALVRIFSPEPWVIERYLSRGVHGLVVPRLDTARQAVQVIDAVRYCRPKDFDQQVIVVQIESAKAVADLKAFLTIPEIDCYFIGPVDLAKSLGFHGDYNHPDVISVIERAIAQIVAARKCAGMLVTGKDAVAWNRRGVRFHYTHLNEYALLGAQAFERARLDRA